MLVRLLVADQSEALVYDYDSRSQEMRLRQKLSDPLARLHDRELVSDKAGRVPDRGPLRSGRRGSMAYHGVGTDKHPRQHEAELFARRIAAELDSIQRQEPRDRWVLMAGPSFLGLLRTVLSEPLRLRVVHEVAKDLLHEPECALRAHLTAEALRAPLS